MKKAPDIHGYLIAQAIASFIGLVLLVFEDFGGYYYTENYVEVWGYIYLGSGVLGSLLILAGVTGLLYAFLATIKSLRTKHPSAHLLRENARKAIKGATLTTIIAGVGAFIFIVTSLDTDWWLDAGFYGAILGGLITLFLGKQILNKL